MNIKITHIFPHSLGTCRRQGLPENKDSQDTGQKNSCPPVYHKFTTPMFGCYLPSTSNLFIYTLCSHILETLPSKLEMRGRVPQKMCVYCWQHFCYSSRGTSQNRM